MPHKHKMQCLEIKEMYSSLYNIDNCTFKTIEKPFVCLISPFLMACIPASVELSKAF